MRGEEKETKDGEEDEVDGEVEDGGPRSGGIVARISGDKLGVHMEDSSPYEYKRGHCDGEHKVPYSNFTLCSSSVL